MGYIHLIFLTVSALAYLLLLFDLGASSGTVLQAIRPSLILVVPILLGSLVLHGRPKVQSKVLKTAQIIAVILSAVYYYSLWSIGFFAGLESEIGPLRWLVRSFAPVLGYTFLSLAIRTLDRKIKALSQVGRLRD
ncbi:MAG: hypothetical protein OXD43_14615 [Bacteroidetes bacterium]|nr:hypothetical protein [Bacteroidota bacterium]